MFFKNTKWALLWAMFILILCGIPGRDIPHISFLELVSVDKFVHAGMFFVLQVLLIRGITLQTNYSSLQRNTKVSAVLSCIIYGGLLELMQDVVFADRSADLFDFIANSVGCISGMLLYASIEKKWLIKFIK
jgi:VanZ family protein